VNKLIVSKLPPDITEDELKEMFKEYGLTAVILVPGKYAVLTFKEFYGAEKAMQAWGRSILRGCWLRIKYAD
jgi:RNA recognition motif-containing protein